MMTFKQYSKFFCVLLKKTQHTQFGMTWRKRVDWIFIFGWSIPLMWNEDMSLSEKIHNITSAKCFCKETETPSVLMRIGSESHNIKCTVTDVWAFTHSREDCALGKMKLSWEYFTNTSQSLIELCCLMRKTQCLLQFSLFVCFQHVS